MDIIIPVIFGLESTVKQELLDFGYNKEQIHSENGQITLSVKESEISNAVATCNIKLRTAERVLVKIHERKATTFDELFDLAISLPWEDYIPLDWAFHVNGYSRKSELFGISACQSIVKKAMVKRLLSKRAYEGQTDLTEDDLHGIIKMNFSIVNDVVTFMIDTSGDGLHKRGYRPLAHAAPIKETLAAGLIILSGWKPLKFEGIMDPMCGSGTIPIEAALIALNIAPGINRSFAAEKWPFIDKKEFDNVRRQALNEQNHDDVDQKFIFAGDIDSKNIKLSKENANRANVNHLISYFVDDIKNLTTEKIKTRTGLDRNIIITNPPYGERLMEKEDAGHIYEIMGANYSDGKSVAKGLRLSIIAPVDVFEKEFGQVADKRRKLYNGMIPCNMYHYFKLNR